MHDELKCWLPKADFTRRDFVVTTLATGFALSVLPVSAETITTDTTGIELAQRRSLTCWIMSIHVSTLVFLDRRRGREPESSALAGPAADRS